MSKALRAAGDLEELRRLLGDECVQEHEPVEVDGVALGATLRPRDGRELGRTLEMVSKRSLAVIIRGGGSRMALGNPPRPAQALLSTGQLTGIETFDSGDGVVHVRAGTPLSELRARVNSEGWELPLDPPGPAATVGGTLAAAAIGPRRLGFGPPRECVLGMEVALPGGARTRCGGRVVKNVTGYDMAKLYTGSLGSLGVIEAAWLRLTPMPELVEVRVAAIEASPIAISRGLELARRPSSRSAALLTPALAARVVPGCAVGRGLLLLAELAGDAPVVQQDLDWLAQTTGAEAPDPGGDVLGALREVQGEDWGGFGLRLRLAVRPSRVWQAFSELSGTQLTRVVHPGLGIVYGTLSPEDGPEGGERREHLEAALRAAERVAEATGGDLLLEAAPTWAKRGRDVFGRAGATPSLMRSIKAGFDPGGVLNPGRFAGGL